MIVTCIFASTGFDNFAPCGGVYHTQCISVGPLFRSRRINKGGLTFPRIKRWGSFICEVCTVRAYLGRELRSTDVPLLLLERMRVIDIAWYWQKGTHSTYQSHLGKITDFESKYKLEVLRTPILKRPPTPPDIPLMWCIEENSLNTANHISRGGKTTPVTFGTIRGIRSAAAQFYQINALIGAPNAAVLSKEGKLIHQVCRPTDGAQMTMFTKGLSKRLGTEAIQAKPITESIVHGIDKDLEGQFRLSHLSQSTRLQIARAGLFNCLLWLGWLRSQECITLRRKDIKVIYPQQGKKHGFPNGVGALCLLLQPETKSSPDQRADVIIASPTKCGLQPLKWLKRVNDIGGKRFKHLFVTKTGCVWTSAYYKKEFLIPYINLEHENKESNTEVDYYSLNCYRRGARTHVDNIILNRSLLRKSGFTESALKAMIYEHGRWRLSSSSDPIDITYRGWGLSQRLRLTRNIY